MHDRHLVSEKRRKLERDEVIKATQERVRVERLLEQAQAELREAKHALDTAKLVHEGWILVLHNDWAGFTGGEVWRHPSQFVITRHVFAIHVYDRGEVHWSCEPHDPSPIRVTAGLSYMPNRIYYRVLEPMLEWWRLQLINLGRYPELPPKGLFERLRETV